MSYKSSYLKLHFAAFVKLVILVIKCCSIGYPLVFGPLSFLFDGDWKVYLLIRVNELLLVLSISSSKAGIN